MNVQLISTWFFFLFAWPQNAYRAWRQNALTLLIPSGGVTLKLLGKNTRNYLELLGIIYQYCRLWQTAVLHSLDSQGILSRWSPLYRICTSSWFFGQHDSPKQQLAPEAHALPAWDPALREYASGSSWDPTCRRGLFNIHFFWYFGNSQCDL